LPVGREKLACPSEAESEGGKSSNPKGLLLPLRQGYEGHSAAGGRGVVQTLMSLQTRRGVGGILPAGRQVRPAQSVPFGYFQTDTALAKFIPFGIEF